MADKFSSKMLKMFVLPIVLVACVLTHANSAAETNKEKKCCCYEVCEKHYPFKDEKDVPVLAACQRGCRLFSLVFHVTHKKPLFGMGITYAGNGCLQSCAEGYMTQAEVTACELGCTSVTTDSNCAPPDYDMPKLSYYSVFIEESDALVQAGDVETNNVLNDPGLRKQFEKTWETLLDSKSSIPETHFRNLPVANSKHKNEQAHMNLNCPKFYVSGFGFGLPQTFTVRNMRFMLSDLYVLVWIFGFVIFCMLVAHHFEMRKMVKKMVAKRLLKYYGDSDVEPTDDELEEGKLGLAKAECKGDLPPVSVCSDNDCRRKPDDVTVKM